MVPDEEHDWYENNVHLYQIYLYDPTINIQIFWSFSVAVEYLVAPYPEEVGWWLSQLVHSAKKK